MTNTPASGGPRRFLFLAVLPAIPILFFALLEAGLRIGGYGNDYPLFVELPGYPEYLIPNPEVGRRYFARTSVVPEPMHDAFRKEKGPGTIRLFVQGASTAAGFPYGHGAAFSRILEQRLQASEPERVVEVVNTSMAAVNSYTLRDLAGEIARAQPDAVLIYAGHNEFFGALGVGSAETLGLGGALTRMYLAIDHLRIVQLMRSLLAPRRKAGRSEGATLMEELAADRVIAPGSEKYRDGLRQFKANLTDLLCDYRRREIPVYVATVVSNERDQAPFDSRLSPATDMRAWEAKLEEVQSLGKGSDLPAALEAASSLVATDDLSALAYFERGGIQFRLGRYEEARADFQAAKDRDHLPFRAPEAANRIIRAAAAECGAELVDVQAAFATASPGGIPGAELMLEHLHPNVEGYLVMAHAFYDAMGKDQVSEEAARKMVLVTPLDSVLAAYHVRRLRNNWPFQPPGMTRPDTIRVTTPVEQLALDVLQGRKTWLAATGELGSYYESGGDYESALLAARALIAEEPYRADAYLLAGNLMLRLSRPGAAVTLFEGADRLQPSARARQMIGHTFILGGRMEEAIPWLRAALELEPSDEAALYDLGVAGIESGHPEVARGAAERLLRIDSRHPGARRLLGRIEGGAL